jgi:hypothetical protein
MGTPQHNQQQGTVPCSFFVIQEERTSVQCAIIIGNFTNPARFCSIILENCANPAHILCSKTNDVFFFAR